MSSCDADNRYMSKNIHSFRCGSIMHIPVTELPPRVRSERVQFVLVIKRECVFVTTRNRPENIRYSCIIKFHDNISQNSIHDNRCKSSAFHTYSVCYDTRSATIVIIGKWCVFFFEVPFRCIFNVLIFPSFQLFTCLIVSHSSFLWSLNVSIPCRKTKHLSFPMLVFERKTSTPFEMRVPIRNP